MLADNQTTILNAVRQFKVKLDSLSIESLTISDYNKTYLSKYKSNFNFYMDLYGQLLLKALERLKNPVADAVFIDYGGGCGILSYLAKEIGFKTVIYNDIYNISVEDAKKISRSLNLKIDHFVHGNIDSLINYLNINDISVDLICSFDVLEHIYDLESWVMKLKTINGRFNLLFMTAANPKNPFIRKRLQKLQLQAEHVGLVKTKGWKNADLNTSFLKARKMIINHHFPSLSQEKVTLLATGTRGLKESDIIEVVQYYLESGKLNYNIQHPTNTCDPYTGNWTEHLIDLQWLQKLATQNQLHATIVNSRYAYSQNKLFNIPKFLLNFVLKITGPNNLFFSPTYTLIIEKRVS